MSSCKQTQQSDLCFMESGPEVVYDLNLFRAEVFTCPARGSCPLLALPDADCVILDDFRPDASIVDVSTSLLWLEGQVIRIQRPLNVFSGHVDFKPCQPTFLTMNWQALHMPRGRWTESELAMLRARLAIFHFTCRILDTKDIEACPQCFCMFVLSGGKDIKKFLDRGFPPVAPVVA